MSIKIIKQGLAESIRDTGRYGYQHWGIGPGGAMDIIAAQAANFLTGNAANEGVLELHFPAAIILFTKPAVIALTGADFNACINEKPVPKNTALLIAANTTLTFTKPIQGAVAYLAVKGGFDIPLWLDSYSTNTAAVAGGFKGRFLQKDDELFFRQPQHAESFNCHEAVTILPLQVNTKMFYTSSNLIRLVKGNEFDWLRETDKHLLAESDFTISTQSNRMGYRLQGPALSGVTDQQLISTAVTNGTIQLLPTGQLIILMADHQVTGGYPRVGHVIAADIPSLAQMPANKKIHFSFVDIQEAETLFINQQQPLEVLEDECAVYYDTFYRN
jgi:antagonist of KipI